MHVYVEMNVKHTNREMSASIACPQLHVRYLQEYQFSDHRVIICKEKWDEVYINENCDTGKPTEVSSLFCILGKEVVVVVVERVSTRVVVVVVVVVAQPDCLPTLVPTEPKSHRSLPKHLPLHTEESLEKVHPATNFTIQSLAASLVK